MINIDSRLFGKVDANEFMLLAYLGSMINEDNICWPGNRRICNDLRWSMERLRVTKNKLKEKGLIDIEERFKQRSATDKKPARTSNYYRVITPEISNFVPALPPHTSKLDIGSDLRTNATLKPGIASTSKPSIGTVRKPGIASTSKPSSEVLVIEELDNESLNTEVLLTEKREDARERDIDYVFLNGLEKLFPNASEVNKKKLREEAANILDYFREPRTIPKYRRGYDSAYIPFWEATQQVIAYSDYCHLSKREPVRSPSKVSEFILAHDYCQLLYDQIVRMGHNVLDPDDGLNSSWLIEAFYEIEQYYRNIKTGELY